MIRMDKISFGALALIFVLSACSTADKTPTEVSNSPSTSPLNRIHINCINQDFSEKSNLTKYENKFTIIPYRKLKTPGKSQEEKDIDDTDNLYFVRVAKMLAKILTQAGLQEAKPTDKNALVIGLSWNSKQKPLIMRESGVFKSNGNGRVDLEKYQNGEVFLSELRMKAVAPDKKTTRWEIDLESPNIDLFYLKVVPPLLVAAKDYMGKTCNSSVDISLAKDSPEVVALKNLDPPQ